MITEEEWDGALKLRRSYASHTVMREARALAASLLGNPDADGSLRLREYLRRTEAAVDEYPVTEFLADLRFLFGLTEDK